MLMGFGNEMEHAK